MSFYWAEKCEPHQSRRKIILKNHPEIKKLIGKNPYTFFIILLCVGLQLSAAFLLKNVSWWWVVIAAYLFGAFICHILYVCMHECAHNLLFKNRNLNLFSGIIANFPTIFPSAMLFIKYHLQHHAYLGVREFDYEVPSAWEARLIGNLAIGKAAWLLFYIVFQGLRIFRLKEIKWLDAWIMINVAAQIIVTISIYCLLGPKAFVFLVLSVFFSVGLHPLGARWIQEHFLTHGNQQETKSYYGCLNFLNLNVGFHNEHHDFFTVPWNKLPQIKKIASAYYKPLGCHTSYIKLLMQFLLNKNLTVSSPAVRHKPVK